MKLGFGELAGHAFGFVDGDHDGLRFAPQALRDRHVLRRQAVLVVDD